MFAGGSFCRTTGRGTTKARGVRRHRRGGEDPSNGSPEQNWEKSLDKEMIIGIPRARWTLTGTIEKGLTWYKGMAKRFMVKWHKEEQKVSRPRAEKRDFKNSGHKTKTTKQGSGEGASGITCRKTQLEGTTGLRRAGTEMVERELRYVSG